MKSLIKVAAATLAASVLLSVAACNKGSKGGGKTITSDTPWFEVSEFEIDTGLDPNRKVQHSYTQLIGSDEKNIAIFTTGNYEYPEDVDWSNFDGTSYQISRVTLLDKATRKTAKCFDLTTLLESGYVEGASYANGKLTLNVSDFDLKTYATTHKLVDIDPETGKQLDSRESKDGDSIQNFTIGKYQVQLCATWTSSSPIYSMNIFSPDGSERKIDFKDTSTKVTYINTIIPLNDKTGLIVADGDATYCFFELDLASGKITKRDNKDYEWLDVMTVYRMKGLPDGNAYSLDSTGIVKLDFNKKTTEQVVNFSWSNLDRNLTNNLVVADVSGDSFIVCGEKLAQQPYSNTYYGMSSEFVMFEVKKADKNPHVGKSILELYSSYGYVSDEINNAVAKFNETNKNYFIEITDRYTSTIGSQSTVVNNEDESSDISLRYMADMSSKLAMDIMNGEGPDMLVNVSSYGALKNSNYLLDLSPYTSKMNSDKYFTNVLDAMKTDGKLYNMPISYGITGIQADTKYAVTTGVGFTTDEYVKFLKDTLNGKDLITSGQAHYFSTLFGNMSEKFIVNRKADFSGPEFKALAEFVKDNVQEKSPDWTQEDRVIEYSSTTAVEAKKAIYGQVSGYWDYIQNVENTRGCSTILGLPSADGRGPTVFAYESLAISAQASNVDACVDFLKILIADETQKELATKGYFVLNRQAFREAGNEAMKYFNTINPGIPFGWYGEGAKPKNSVTYTSEHVDALEKVIESCSSSSSADAAVSIILIEEMPSYFTGQKELGNVIKIAQDRVQKVLNERQ